MLGLGGTRWCNACHIPAVIAGSLDVPVADVV